MGSLTISTFSSVPKGAVHFFGTRQAPRQWIHPEEIGIVNEGSQAFPVVVAVKQVHGTDVLILNRSLAVGEPLSGEWDAIISNQPEVLLTVRTADCVPVLLHDPIRQVVAAIHAGWRGAVKEIVPKTLGAMEQQFGSHPSEMHMAIGPSAGPCCYEVDTPVIEPLRAALPEWGTVLNMQAEERGYLDLKGIIHQQALQAGMSQENVHRLDLCTVCREDLFYSYRREGTRRGTMVSGIMLTP